MKSKNDSYHVGIVKKIDDEKISVVLEDTSHCVNCNAKTGCVMGVSKETIIEIKNTSKFSFNINEKVLIHCNESMELNAVFWAYVLPFVLIIITIVLTYYFSNNELITGVLGLGILLPYYLLLYLLKFKFQNTFSFSIHKKMI